MKLAAESLRQGAVSRRREARRQGGRVVDHHRKRDALGVEAAQKRLDKTYGMLDDELAKRTWLLGDAFTLADISAAAALGIANMVRPFGAHKNLMAYFGRLTERPSVQRAFKQVQEHMARG